MKQTGCLLPLSFNEVGYHGNFFFFFFFSNHFDVAKSSVGHVCVGGNGV